MRFQGLVSILALVVSAAGSAQADLVITMGGDVGFNKAGAAPRSEGAVVGGRTLRYDHLVSGIAKLVDGDLNFANIETVVSSRANLRPAGKRFNFVTHPNGLRAMIEAGFNLFSLANNHATDYGITGLRETRQTMARFQQENADVQFHGGGENRAEAGRPAVFEKNGYKIAFAAIGIMDPLIRATDSAPGMLHYTTDEDYTYQLRALRDTQADLKILSIHTGREARIELDAGQRAKFNRAITEAGVDLVIGHHPHVVRPIESVDGKLVIYSLGNYMMLGAANIDGRPAGYDYGLFGRIYFGWDSAEKKLKAQAMEVIPLRSMHLRAVPAEPKLGRLRIQMLNLLAKSQLGSRAVVFTERRDGTGVVCGPSNTVWTARAAQICGSSAAPAPAAAIPLR